MLPVRPTHGRPEKKQVEPPNSGAGVFYRVVRTGQERKQVRSCRTLLLREQPMVDRMATKMYSVAFQQPQAIAIPLTNEEFLGMLTMAGRQK